MENPLLPFIERQGVVILDGGLATELEGRGVELDDRLWSALALAEQPDLIRTIHRDYLGAGADCIVSASYQATIEGFLRAGFTDAEALELLQQSVLLATETRDEFWSHSGNRRGRMRPLVAASVGPYGAYLADGSEFRGDYDLDREQLSDFHRRRWGVLAASGADLLACETIPSAVEAVALAELACSTPETPVWISFSCRSAGRLRDGSALRVLVQRLSTVPQIVAFGVNCSPPVWISEAISAMRASTSKPILAYPNSGETWDAENRRWRSDGADLSSLARQAESWVRAGAHGIGGCCRTTPATIAALRRALIG